MDTGSKTSCILNRQTVNTDLAFPEQAYWTETDNNRPHTVYQVSECASSEASTVFINAPNLNVGKDDLHFEFGINVRVL